MPKNIPNRSLHITLLGDETEGATFAIIDGVPYTKREWDKSDVAEDLVRWIGLNAERIAALTGRPHGSC